MPAGDLIERHWKPVVDRFFDAGLEALPPHEQRYFLVVSLLGDVDEGGLEQYLSGSLGALLPQAADALEAIGDAEAAANLREVAGWFPGGTPAADDAERARQVSELSNPQLGALEEIGDALADREGDILRQLETHLAPHYAT